MSYQTKIKKSQIPLVQKLLSIVLEKKTNIALSADVNSQSELLKLAENLGPYICLLKTHIDIIQDFDSDLSHKLNGLANKHQFLILEDRKFADIGSTTFNQYRDGIYQINQWAHLVTAHGFVGKGLIEGLIKANQELNSNQSSNRALIEQRGVLLLAQMSCDTPYFDDKYAKSIAAMADAINEKNSQSPPFVTGFIAQNPSFLTPEQLSNYLIATPGVNLEMSKDDLGQQYNTPDKLIQQGSDILIVGRGIYQSDNPVKKALQYQKVAWQAHLDRL